MTYVVTTNESISDLALAVYDEKDEILREIVNDDLTISITANQRSIQRFYLIGELLYSNLLTVRAEVEDDSYIVKVIIGKESPRFSDFIEYTSSYTTSFKASDFKFLNALPVDIYVESTDFNLNDVTLNITIEVDNNE